MSISLEILSLPDLTQVLTDMLEICSPKDYSLDIGDYRVIGIHSVTGEQLPYDVSITEGDMTPLNIVFTPPKHNLTISATAGGTTIPEPGVHEYEEDSTVTIRATPDSGYVFDKWVIDGSDNPNQSVNILMDRDHVAQAVFSAITPRKGAPSESAEFTIIIHPVNEHEDTVLTLTDQGEYVSRESIAMTSTLKFVSDGESLTGREVILWEDGVEKDRGTTDVNGVKVFQWMAPDVVSDTSKRYKAKFNGDA